MPRYFFDTDDGEKLIRDEVGVDLNTLEDAKHEAMCALPEIAETVMPDGDQRDFVITVMDEHRQPLLRLKLALTVDKL